MNNNELLRESIAHWERLKQDVEGEVIGSAGCRLCQIYYEAHRCVGCPIMLKTGKPYCLDTPYWIANKAFGRNPNAFIQAAQAEIDFLTSLLDETLP